MNWLSAIIKGLFGSIWEHFQSQAEKPKVITHAETPPAKLKEFQDDIEAFKKRKDNESKPPTP